MDNNYIIRNAYSYFDKWNQKNKSILDSIYSNESKWEEVSKGNDMESAIIQWKDKNNNILFKSKYELLAIEFTTNEGSLWVWAWAHPHTQKNKTLISRKLLNYGLDITNLDESNNLFLKTLLTTSRLKLNDVEIGLCLVLSFYLSKASSIVNLRISDNETFWILLK